MKRFFCTICDRVKRVRVLPASLKSTAQWASGSTDPKQRKGQCRWHNATKSNGKKR